MPEASAVPPRITHTPKGDETQPPKRTIRDKIKDVKKDLSARAETAKQLIGIACLPLAGAAAVHTARYGGGDPNHISPYSLDVAAVSMHSDALAEAVAELADVYPVLGNTLDKIGMMVPGAAIVGVGLLIAMQIAENHGKLSESARTLAPVPIVPRDEMAQMIRSEIADREAATVGGNGA
jgi:hypothetical protein